MSAFAGAWWLGSVQDRVGGQAGGEGNPSGQATPGRPPVQGVAHYVDDAVGQGLGEEVDHGSGLLGLGDAGLGYVQAKQDGQADLTGQERHGHHDPDDHEAVAAPDAVASFGRAVVLVLRAVDLLSIAVEQGVVHREVTAAPRGTKRATTARARASPTWSRFQTAREKNRCARDQVFFCHPDPFRLCGRSTRGAVYSLRSSKPPSLPYCQTAPRSTRLTRLLCRGCGRAA